MKVLAIGASRNIGYLASIQLLQEGHTVIFLLRNLTAFDSDAVVQSFVNTGKAILVKGDAGNKGDVAKAYELAALSSDDFVLFTVGGALSFQAKGGGFVITPPNLTTCCLTNLLQVMAANSEQPKLIAITSTGVTKASHDNLPFGFKWFYSYTLRSPHADKLGMERLLQYAMGRKWAEAVEPQPEILPADWMKDYPSTGWLQSTCVVRPAFLTDGPMKGVYRTSCDEFSSYTVSRRDVAHFLVEGVIKNWPKWKGTIANVGY